MAAVTFAGVKRTSLVTGAAGRGLTAFAAGLPLMASIMVIGIGWRPPLVMRDAAVSDTAMGAIHPLTLFPMPVMMNRRPMTVSTASVPDSDRNALQMAIVVQ